MESCKPFNMPPRFCFPHLELKKSFTFVSCIGNKRRNSSAPTAEQQQSRSFLLQTDARNTKRRLGKRHRLFVPPLVAGRMPGPKTPPHPTSRPPFLSCRGTPRRRREKKYKSAAGCVAEEDEDRRGAPSPAVFSAGSVQSLLKLIRLFPKHDSVTTDLTSVHQECM